MIHLTPRIRDQGARRLGSAGLLASGFLAFALFSVAVAGPFEEGVAALQRGDFATALRLLRPLAASGNADAQFNLGWMYANGKGVSRDDKEAIVWHRKAAEQGNAYAQAALGVMYGNGYGVPQDYGQAIIWIRKGRRPGNSRRAVQPRLSI
jgi:TPR repeat protein